MSRAVIFANGWLGQPPALTPDDVVIAADGGSRHCLQLGIRPNVVIGDLDSLTPDHLAALQALGAEIISYPARKDYTDLELALRYAGQRGYRPVIVAAALGQRWDQTLANLLLPAALPEMDIRLVDGPQEIFLIRGGAPAQIEGRPGDTVSLIPLAGDAHTGDALGVHTSGLEYPLHGERLLFGGTRGVSNVLLGARAEVSLETGLLVCVVIHENLGPDFRG